MTGGVGIFRKRDEDQRFATEDPLPVGIALLQQRAEHAPVLDDVLARLDVLHPPRAPETFHAAQPPKRVCSMLRSAISPASAVTIWSNGTPGVSMPSRSRTVYVPASMSRSPTTTVYGTFISCADRIFLPTDSFAS